MRHITVFICVLTFIGACAEPRDPSGDPARPDASDRVAPAPAPTDAAPTQARAPDGVAWLGTDAVRYDAYGWNNLKHPERAVVLVHGWASDRSVWDAQATALAAHTRVITIDLPGHGDSDLPEATLTMDLFAEAIGAVLDDAGIERAALVGHSNGTPAIRQFYRMSPKRTAALIVVDGALRRMFGDEAAAQFHESLASPEYADFVTTMIDGMAGASPDPEAMRERLVPTALGTPQRALVEAFDAGADPSIWFEDPIGVPTLIVLAEAPFWTDEYERYVRSLTSSDFEYHTLPGVSHYLQIDAPERFNEILLSFLRTIDFIDS